MRASSLRLVGVLITVAVIAALGAQFAAAGAIPPGTPVFQRTWERTDKPVAELRVARTWIWGPSANTGVIQEAYAESVGGMRDVQYFDKARMEIPHSGAVDDGLWYVTNGLLATELITGQMQMGDNLFQSRTPAAINVAGDENDPIGPTYATFRNLLDEAPAVSGATLTQRLARDGTITNDATLATYGVTAAQHVEIDGIDHQIASPFWAFMNSSGEVYDDGHYVTESMFQNPYYAIGYPISEAYWATIKVGGTPRDVLTQVFERRVLTYTPANPAGWQVEMGNIGRHYYAWRYGTTPAAPAAPTAVMLAASNPTDCVTTSGVTECDYTLTLSWTDASSNEDGFKITTSFDTTTYTAAANATTWSKEFRLQPGKVVTLSIVAWNAGGESAKVASNAVTLPAQTPVTIAAPADVTLQASAPSECTFAGGKAVECDYTLTVTWTDKSNNEDGFEIRPSFSTTTYKVAADVKTWSHVFRLEPREHVSVEVRAFNAAAQSAWVESAEVEMPSPTPAAPTDVKLVISAPTDCDFTNGVATECAYTLTVTWKDQSNDEVGFRVRPNFTTTTKEVAQNVTTWSGTFRLEPREWVSVSVQAYSATGESLWVESEPAYLHEPTKPLVPTNVALAISSPTDCTIVGGVAAECAYTLTLTWKDASNNEDGFKITASFDTATYTVAANITTWSKVFRLAPGKDVTLSIVAFNVIGSSPAVVSNKVTTQPPAVAVPAAPTEVVLTVSAPYDCKVGKGSTTCNYDITLKWKDMSTNEAGFAIRRQPDAPLHQVGPNVTTWTETERLTPGDTLVYEVRAENAAGASAWVQSNVVLLKQ